MSTEPKGLVKERTVLVAELRALAQRLEDLPLEKAEEAVAFIARGTEDLRGRAALLFGDRPNADPRNEPIEVAEGAATVEVVRHLRQHVGLAGETYNLVNAVVPRMAGATVGETPLPRRIAIVLLVRLANDLRSIIRLSVSGYPLQAATLVASAYEIACAIVLIGTDADRAREWLDHENPQRLPAFLEDMKRAATEVLRELGAHDDQLLAQADNAYRVYAQLCMAKHGNPRLQRELATVRRGDQFICVPGPIPIQEAERVTAYALENAVVVTCWALASSLSQHVPPDRRADLEEQLRLIVREQPKLQDLVRERGWDGDPWQRWSLPSGRKKPKE
jgi:hypothetical protein